ncbi:furin-like protease kpc-1 isoform X3 [Cherax quadricarinatus]
MDSNDNRKKRSTNLNVINLLAQEPKVKWVDQQKLLIRSKRQLIFKTRPSKKYEEENDQWSPRDIKGRERFHSLPSNVQNSRTMMAKLRRRRPEFVRNREPQWRAQENLDYWTMKEEELEINKNSLSHKQSTAQEPSFKHKLMTIPLFRTIGNSVDLARARLAASRSIREYDAQHFVDGDYARPYFLRNNVSFIQPKTIINTEHESKDIYLNSSHSSLTTGIDDFGKWIDSIAETTMAFNDPLYKDQWYLHNTGQLGHAGYDLNVTWAWLRGYTGRGVHLSILDDGIQTTNADIAANYFPDISYSVIHDGQPLDDPSPRIDPSFSNSHGTYCAAIVAAVPNNSVCGVGVAYEAKVGGVRIVDGTVTDIQEATALSRHLDKVDVFSASWGPMDDGTKVEGPGRLAKQAFLEGVTKGRDGKGIVYVWASGNGGLMGDNCNLDGYTSSIYSLSVSALTEIGTSTFYEEPCASTLAAVYVGGDHSLQAAIEQQKQHKKALRIVSLFNILIQRLLTYRHTHLPTTRTHNRLSDQYGYLNNVVPELDGHCSESFQGTSAAAPLMAGIVTLVLHANPNLTWRDMQYLVVETAVPTKEALEEEGWQTNGRGKKFHLLQGYGAVDAGKMVEAALKWKNVTPQTIAISSLFNGYRTIYPDKWLNISKDLTVSDVTQDSCMKGVEHVIANITLTHRSRKQLSIFIVSPSGTTSQVLTHRSSDNSTVGFKSWEFMSVHFWGEHPAGIWTVAIKNSVGERGYLKKIELVIYGT